VPSMHCIVVYPSETSGRCLFFKRLNMKMLLVKQYVQHNRGAPRHLHTPCSPHHAKHASRQHEVTSFLHHLTSIPHLASKYLHIASTYDTKFQHTMRRQGVAALCTADQYETWTATPASPTVQRGFLEACREPGGSMNRVIKQCVGVVVRQVGGD
jgi:hypothetical protein